MPIYRIRSVNSEIRTETDVGDFAKPEEALAAGMRGAVAIAADDIEKGIAASSVVVTVVGPDERPVLRSAISLSVAPLLVD